jgi:hypothetical protein
MRNRFPGFLFIKRSIDLVIKKSEIGTFLK